ncbi:hypothetical protein I4U23_000672 [Adineta vaga]|nr:hypothetical protein I4U23_000672 [Adineta vaga]
MFSFIVLSIILAAGIDFLSADVVVYTSGNYKLTIVNNDPNFDQNTRQRCIDTFFATMPQMYDRFNRNGCTRDVVITIDPGYNGVTHECMHVVQRYPRGDPGWLIEGIADYARWKYGRNNPAAN